MPPRPLPPIDYTVLEKLGFRPLGPGRVRLEEIADGFTLEAELCLVLRADLRPPPDRKVRLPSAAPTFAAQVVVTLPSGDAIGAKKLLVAPTDLLPLMAELLAPLLCGSHPKSFERFATFHTPTTPAPAHVALAKKKPSGVTRRFRVDSQNLAELGYDIKTKHLEVIFLDAPTVLYTYSNVPAKIFLNLIQADSLGSYFARYIRTKYKFTSEKLS